jgi:cupin 2 domain-containing protein
MQVKNIFSLEGIPFDSQKEFFEALSAHGDLKIERIVSRGHVSPPDFWYEQPQHEWVVLLQGSASLEFEKGRMAHLKAGDFLLLPAGLKHRVAYTSKEPACIWLAVHFK